jgi:hypothetical protein
MTLLLQAAFYFIVTVYFVFDKSSENRLALVFSSGFRIAVMVDVPAYDHENRAYCRKCKKRHGSNRCQNGSNDAYY